MERREKRILQKRLMLLRRQEQCLLAQQQNPLSQKAGELGAKISAKLPAQGTAILRAAFEKGLRLIVERGGPILGKAGGARRHREIFEREQAALHQRFTRWKLGGFARRAGQTNLGNQAISVAEGGVLGVLGIGLPDIPLFLAMLCKSVREVAQSYGFDGDAPGEWSFLLAVLCAGVAEGEQRRELSASCDQMACALAAGLSPPEELEHWIERAAALLAERMTVAKSVQGIPLAGVVGGVANGAWMGAVGRMATIKYQKRFLWRLDEN